MEELLQKVKLFREERGWDKFHSPKNLAMALIVESAELAEHFQWLTEEESRNIPEDELLKVKDEIADVLIYLVNLADKLGLDPVQAAHDKIVKNIEKYPV
ncbi:MAG: nucleotide pyrophosphohydrolase [Desulfobulbaceae bacterium]|nr:nucleotide pyrophosphohydrolase [Desulfobulbaceae bacterium]